MWEVDQELRQILVCVSFFYVFSNLILKWGYILLNLRYCIGVYLEIKHTS